MEIKILPLRINNKKSTFYRSGKLPIRIHSNSNKKITLPPQDKTGLEPVTIVTMQLLYHIELLVHINCIYIPM